MFRVAPRIHVIFCITLLLSAVTSVASPPLQTMAQTSAETLVYHQITEIPEETGGVGYPVLSADGSTVVFTNAPGTGDPEIPNRILTVDADGSNLQEVDSYTSLCYCTSMVDISADGSKVVSSDGIQIRIVDGSARELLTLGGEITGLVISGDGETVFFIIRRDTAIAEDQTPIARGIWAIDADGNNLRQIAGADDVADALGVTIEETGCCFHSDGSPLDVSDSGDEVVFGAYAAGAEHLLAVNGDGSDVRPLLDEGATYVFRVAISGDGELVAYDVVMPSPEGTNEIGVVPFSGGPAEIFGSYISYGVGEPITLSEDGSKLLLAPAGLLLDTGTGEIRLLATSITHVGGNFEAVLTDGLARATMNAEANLIVYAMRTARCADCVALQEQLATLEIAPGNTNGAPEIIDATIDPDTIGLQAASDATITATIETTDDVLGVGYAAFLDGGVIDANVGSGLLLLDDGTGADVRANDDIYTLGGIVHSYRVTREIDTGSRTVRIAVEVTDTDGLRHATAVDIGTLTVGD